jgi:hypothetical protein
MGAADAALPARWVQTVTTHKPPSCIATPDNRHHTVVPDQAKRHAMITWRHSKGSLEATTEGAPPPLDQRTGIKTKLTSTVSLHRRGSLTVLMPDAHHVLHGVASHVVDPHESPSDSEGGLWRWCGARAASARVCPSRHLKGQEQTCPRIDEGWLCRWGGMMRCCTWKNTYGIWQWSVFQFMSTLFCIHCIHGRLSEPHACVCVCM